ncbi:hypothetical protein SAMN04488066_104112 [Halorubrum aquaticum]|uniref:Uncharacterized protein n=1 Tax=Halorubrum aquaticum TaxID=387340 RepID=A0A1I3A3G0_9EURY|nr:hypothetical protein SAMN04488066_104112 [Halorubrum aquaticum]
MYQSQYPVANVIGGDERLVVTRGKHSIERSRPVPCFDIVVAIGLDQLVRRGRIFLGFEPSIEFTEPPIGIAGYWLVFTVAVTFLLSLPVRLASPFIIRVLVQTLSVICHIS